MVNFGPEPQLANCPYCNSNVITRVYKKATMMTHIMALLLCFFFCWPCAICPYCIDSCLVSKHYCPNCGSYLGKYED